MNETEARAYLSEKHDPAPEHRHAFSERIVLIPRSLDVNGRCCDRKPIFYKTVRGSKAGKDPHHFCCRCCAEFAPDGRQRENWAWLRLDDGRFISRSLESFRNSDCYVKVARLRYGE